MGDHTVRAEYGGTSAGTRAGAQSAGVQAEVGAAVADLQLDVDVSSPSFGQPVELIATLALQSPASAPVVGQFEFFDGNDESLGTVTIFSMTLNTGTATLTLDDLPVGLHEVYAVFHETTSINRAESAPVQFEVLLANAEVSLAVAPETSQLGEDFTVTSRVTSSFPTAFRPTGEVQFTVNGEDWGDPVGLDAGAAALTITGLPIGTAEIRAHYSGDAGYNAMDSAVVGHVVTAQEVDTGAAGLPVTGAETAAPIVLIGMLFLMTGACALMVRRRTKAA